MSNVARKTLQRWQCVTLGKRAVLATLDVWRTGDGYFVTLVPAGMPAGYDGEAVALKTKTTALSVAKDRRREFRSSALVRWERTYP